jgi:hypothetical protein
MKELLIDEGDVRHASHDDWLALNMTWLRLGIALQPFEIMYIFHSMNCKARL